ncbi:hypothetical protein BDF20DRAFT_550758 [Mycotypha africana]|uniref:uncharacterized protein n=1 Tax=Mycotypha africana TaxID=64632 RepID=UPI002301AFF1|nr:uncharacterized protein BDF20DRAFT_550758 [Mycotypha africana]KAI8977195.1 hypothetical protein BDF20DRAFT_550758 [Mycotypha africana]
MIAVVESNNNSSGSHSSSLKISSKSKDSTACNNTARFPFIYDMTSTANSHDSDSSSVYTVVLQPKNPTLQTRHLELREDGNRIRIGRQISARTIPHRRNGYFDSKVLSRQHAELYCADGKVYIRDVKSSNGTFVNGERLSDEGKPSLPKRIFNEDIIEFGIDIINDENGSVLFHKVVCKVFLYPEPLSQIEERLANFEEDDTNGSYTRFSSSSSPASSVYISSKNDSMSSLTNSLASARTSSKHHKSTTSKSDKLPIDSEQDRQRLKELLQIETLIKDELKKSKKVETELLNIKQTVTEVNKLIKDDNNTDETERKLAMVEKRLTSYDKKWQLQHAAIEAAKKELHSWDNRYYLQGKKNVELSQALEDERQKVERLEQLLKHNTHQKSKESLLLASIIVGIISLLLFALYN